MNPIEGVDPKSIVAAVDDDLTRERVAAAARVVGCVRKDVGAWKAELSACESRMDKLRKQIAAAEERIAKFCAGDWRAIEEPKPQKQESVGSVN